MYIFSIEFKSERLSSRQFMTRFRTSKDTLIEINFHLHTVVKTMMSVVIINDRPGEHWCMVWSGTTESERGGEKEKSRLREAIIRLIITRTMATSCYCCSCLRSVSCFFVLLKHSCVSILYLPNFFKHPRCRFLYFYCNMYNSISTIH